MFTNNNQAPTTRTEANARIHARRALAEMNAYSDTVRDDFESSDDDKDSNVRVFNAYSRLMRGD